VTEQRQAHAQRLAQQWAQAVLQEREQLAHELHDGLSQSLAFLHMQAQTSLRYLDSQQPAAARAHLTRLAEASREMQGDLRELIGNLLAVSLPSEGFCASLRQIVTHFEQQSGLAVRLRIDRSAEAACDPTRLPPAIGVQLVRIVQEALANVRKHAGSPTDVEVHLLAEAGQVHLAITDNGAGFDPDALGAAREHFGLQVMHQRAAHIGGTLVMRSAPGAGTRVEVCVPLGTGGATP
jgi:signal transduction histidine kinase